MKLTLNSPVSTFLEFERLDTVYSQEGAHYLAFRNLLELLTQYEELADEPYSELLSIRQVLREPALTVFTMKEFESQFIFIRTATGISKINRSGFLSTYYTISEEKVFQIQ